MDSFHSLTELIHSQIVEYNTNASSSTTPQQGAPFGTSTTFNTTHDPNSTPPQYPMIPLRPIPRLISVRICKQIRLLVELPFTNDEDTTFAMNEDTTFTNDEDLD